MLPYSTEVLVALYVRYLGEQWPLALPVALLTLAVAGLARRGAGGGRVAGALLALGWLWVGMVFQLGYFAGLNFAAPLYGGLFAVQGALLLWQGPVRGRLALGRRSDAAGRVGALIMLYAVFGYPLLDALDGFPLVGLRWVGLAPGPTALFTLGVLLFGAQRIPRQLLPIPAVWSLIAGYSGWVLSNAADLLLPLATAVALAAAYRYRSEPAPDAAKAR